jgi:prevent-host-death family protein
MKLSERVRPISWLKSHAAGIVRAFEEDRSPLIVTRNGEAKIVVMDIRTYEEQIETMAFLKLINMGRKDISAGKFQSVDSFYLDTVGVQ